MVSLIIVGLYALGHFGLGITPTDGIFFVPEIVLVLASITTLYSLAAYLLVKDNRLHLAGLIAYVAMCITVILLVVLSGGIHSPFIGLWLLVAGFSGLFGVYMIGAFAIAANVYGLYYLATGLETGGAAVALMIVVEAPLIASYIIWHNRVNGHDTQAVNALQAQLSQVSSKSDVIINSIADGVVVIDSRGIVH